MTVLVIDNYDSFTYNLVHYIGELGAKLAVRRNDKITVDEVMAMDPEAIVLSPGPCTPNEAGICLDLIRRAGPEIPIFGVCLGHQAIGQVYGGTVVRAPRLMHGKVGDHQPHRPRRLPRHQWRLPGDPLSLADRRAGDHAGRAGADGTSGGRRHHGRHAQDPSGPRRPVPPGIDRFRARPYDPQEFPRHRRPLERKEPRGAVRSVRGSHG